MARPLLSLIDEAWRKRQALIARLQAEGTECYRLFHGVSEGRPGLTIDRYGPLVLLQTFREPLEPAVLSAIERQVRGSFGGSMSVAYNHRGPGAAASPGEKIGGDPGAEFRCREFGASFLVRPSHRGIDPWLFLDLRAGRRRLRGLARGASVLNLFSYTCSAGVCAAAAGASEVWNIDFSSSSLEVGRSNAKLNGMQEPGFRVIREDCLPAMRQLAGLPPGGRRGKRGRFQRFEPRRFDLVFLDPPAWSVGRFGAVDVANDYASLFKPALLAAKPGGQVIATNHVSAVRLEAWTTALKACAAKAGSPLRSLETIEPEADFPSFDGRPALKIAVCGT